MQLLQPHDAAPRRREEPVVSIRRFASTVVAAASCQAQAAGARGAAYARTNLSLQQIPPVGQPATLLGSLTFTPPFPGTVVLRARGYCNLKVMTSV